MSDIEHIKNSKYLIETLDSDDISMKINKIINAINILDVNIEKIQLKIKDITDIYMRFEFNKNLALTKTNSYLKFQVELLQNEKKYYSNIKTIILEKLAIEIYDIAEYSLIILISLEDIDIGYVEEKKNIIKRITKIKKKSKTSCDNIVELINSTIKNLNLIYDFLKLIQKYINEIITDTNKNNIHCNNFEISILNKKNRILLEYNKYCEQLKESVNYFLDCSNSIINQLKNQEIFNFFIEGNNT